MADTQAQPQFSSLDDLLAAHPAQPVATGADPQHIETTPVAPKPYATLDDLLANHGGFDNLTAPGFADAPTPEAAVNSSAGRILKAFGLPIAEAVGGPESQTAADLEKAVGIDAAVREHQDSDKGIGRAFVSAIAYPAAQTIHGLITAGDLATRAVMGTFGGLGEAAIQAGKETGTETGRELGQTAAGLLEYEGTRGDILAGHTEVPHVEGVEQTAAGPRPTEGMLNEPVQPEPYSAPAWSQRDALIDESHNLVMGQHPDQETYFGQVPPRDENMIPGEPAPDVPRELPTPADVHSVARSIDPEAFAKFDDLDQQQDTLRNFLSVSQAERARTATAPIDAKIDALMRNPAASQERIDALLPDLQQQRDEAVTKANAGGDTEDMAHIRQLIQQIDYQKRDLAPRIGEATRQAGEGVPDGLIENEVPATTQEAQPSKTETPAPAEAAEGSAPAAVSGAPEVPKSIAQQVSEQLTAAGRPADEAQAAGALIQAHYETMADRFGGKIGTAQEIYEREAPDVVNGARVPARELAQRQGSSELFQPAYHGTPHDFEKFTTDHIGSGEGAQAYGWGLYFAGNRSVAKFYREKLTRGQRGDIYLDGTKLGDETGWLGAAVRNMDAMQKEAGWTEAKAKADQIAGLRFRADRSEPGEAAEMREAADRLERANKIEVKKPGNLYHVDIAPTDDELVDWDKPISEQPEKIKAAFDKLGVGGEATDGGSFLGIRMKLAPRTGAEAYKQLANRMGAQGASEALGEEGVRGIRYLDQSSRSATGDKARTHNYVVFDGADVAIKEFEQQSGDLDQPRRGKIGFVPASKPIITLFGKADASTFIHETGHAWLEELNRMAAHPEAPDDIKADAGTVLRWLGAKDAESVTTAQHERFARGFERYMMEGRAPTRGMARVFEQFRTWLSKIYDSVKQLRSPITDDIRDVFDRLITTRPEKIVIAPDRARQPTLADIHERDAAEARGDTAHGVAETMTNERDRAAAVVQTPEENHARLEGIDAEAGERTEGGAQSGGDESAAGNQSGEGPPPEGARTIGEGRGSGENFGAGALPKSKRLAPIYEPIPRRPASLVDFLRMQGGLRDDTFAKRVNTAAGRGAARANPTELRAALIAAEGSGGRVARGLMRAKTGLALDDAGEKAAEAGYFDHRPTPDELVEAISGELNGERHYSSFDKDKVDAYHSAVAKNSEIDRISHDLRIGIEGKTPLQFWNEVIAKQSAEQTARDVVSQDKAHQEAFDDAERRAKEWVETRGDAWEPDAIYGADRPRSLEDLEREQQEEAAAFAKSQGRPDGGEQSGPAAGYSGDVQAGGGSRGSGSELGRGDEPGIPEPGQRARQPVNPDRLPKAESDLVDKAGNIRLDNLNTPEDINEVIRQTAADNGDFMAQRRGVISAAAQLQLAEDLGMQSGDLNFRRIGQAFNAEQIIAIRKMLRQSAVGVRDAWATFNRTGADADGLAVSEAVARHSMIQEHVAGVTAEAGRALGAFRSLKADSGDHEFGQSFTDLLKRLTGKTVDQLKQESKFGATLDSPQKVSAWVTASKQGGFGRMVLEYYINNLLSGPITHAHYFLGTQISALWHAGVETPISAGVGRIFQALSPAPIDRVVLNEAGAQLYGLASGAIEGWRAAGQALKNGIRTPLPGERALSLPGIEGHPLASRGAIPGAFGEVIRLPSRGVSAIHTLNTFMSYEQHIATLAARQATKEGKIGQSYMDRVADLQRNPSQAWMEEAHDFAFGEAYMRRPDYNSFFGKIVQASNSNLAAKFVVPFLQVGGNITRGAFIDRSPLGLLSSEVRDNVLRGNGSIAQQEAIGKMVAGTGLILTTMVLVSQGLMTGGGPRDPNAYREWMRAGNRPYSFHIGNWWVSYNRLGSLSMLMKFASDGYSAASALSHGQLATAAAGFFEAVSMDVLDENWMRGVHDALDAMFNFPENGVKYIEDQALNFVPASVGLSQLQREIDPQRAQVLRSQGSVLGQAHAFINEAMSKIPFASRGLYPQLDWTGQPLDNTGVIDHNMGPDATDLAIERLEDLGYPVAPAKMEPRINGVALSDRQYFDYSKLAGNLTKTRLDGLVNSRSYEQMTPYQQATQMRQIVTDSREKARGTIMMQNQSIRRASDQAKKDARDGNPRPRGTIQQGE